MITEIIKDALKDCIILKGSDEVDNVYNWGSIPLIKGILDDAHVSNSVYVYLIPGDNHDMPDNWCAVTWSEAGSLHTIGFNWMSEDRERKLELFNRVANDFRYGYVRKH